MPHITRALLRRRAEHNEGQLSTLEELTLHQEELEGINEVRVRRGGLGSSVHLPLPAPRLGSDRSPRSDVPRRPQTNVIGAGRLVPPAQDPVPAEQRHRPPPQPAPPEAAGVPQRRAQQHYADRGPRVRAC